MTTPPVPPAPVPLGPPDLDTLARDKWTELLVVPATMPRGARVYHRRTEHGYLAVVVSPATYELHILHRTTENDETVAGDVVLLPNRPPTVAEIVSALSLLPVGTPAILGFVATPEPKDFPNPVTLTLTMPQMMPAPGRRGGFHRA